MKKIILIVLLVSLAVSAGLYFLYLPQAGEKTVATPGVFSGEPGGIPAIDPVSAINRSVSAGEEASPTYHSVADDNEGPDKDPKMQSSIADLVNILDEAGSAAAADFAGQSGMSAENGQVRIVVEAVGEAGDIVPLVSSEGGTVEAVHKNLVQAFIPFESIDIIKASGLVSYIRQPRKPTLSAISEGVADTGADVWHTEGATGEDVKLVVLDVGFYGYQQRISEGELPADLIPVSFRTDGDITGGNQSHGTACAEIAYDMAPGAQMYLVNFNTDVELGNAVDYLISEGVDVVSASWGFYGGFRGDGQGDIDDMVQEAYDAGIFWANAAGNSAATHWSGDFTDSDTDGWNEYSLGDEGNDIYLSAGATIDIYLTWNDWPLSDQDYDLYLCRAGGVEDEIVAYSNGLQDGSQAPAEGFRYTVPAGESGFFWVKIYDYDADGDATFQLYTTPYNLEYSVSAGSMGGQPTDSPYAVTVGAVPVGGTVLESFSSRGPTIDGRIKPDFVAPNRVSTSTYGPYYFSGTSASAPHMAGAAALVKGILPAQDLGYIKSYLELRATDLGDPGKDNLYGSGKLDMGLFPSELDPPEITSVQPGGTINTVDASVAAYYTDSGSGIDTATTQITLDGIVLEGCDVTVTYIDCPTTGLESGDHDIGGLVVDNDGNFTPVSGSFYVDCFKPQLSPDSPTPFWASYKDYAAGILSVTVSFCNSGENDAFDAEVVGSMDTRGVLMNTPMPATVGTGTVASQSCEDMTFQFKVPAGVSSFNSTLFITAENSCSVLFYYPYEYIS